MRIRYEIAVEDLLAFSVHHHQKSPTLRRNRFLTVVVLAGMIVWLSFVAAESLRIPEVLWIGTALAALFAVVYLRTWKRGMNRVMTKLYAEGRNRGALGVHLAELRDEGFYRRTSCGEQTVFWNGIERIESIPGYTFVYVSALSAHVLPEHSVIEGSFQAFVEELQRRWQESQAE
jgi:hypothetical protein